MFSYFLTLNRFLRPACNPAFPVRNPMQLPFQATDVQTLKLWAGRLTSDAFKVVALACFLRMKIPSDSFATCYGSKPPQGQPFEVIQSFSNRGEHLTCVSDSTNTVEFSRKLSSLCP
ncbi:hypothetical protein P7K49_020606 [Saguinus oedipus]|uniref:Uncharacterized protein n=1 Tax=Saguinus oedipus TaxID=9490 RepID=A0ABQ9V1R9_SAGOE|nr:hypothetical protein P7K49_020606 [Saguinus oedipus]